MSRNKKRTSTPAARERRRRTAPADAGPRPDSLTVACSLAVMTAFACEIGVVLARVGVALASSLEWLGLLGGLLFFAALVVGAIGLMLLLIVVRRKRAPVPRPLIGFAMAVGVAPWLYWLVERLV